jgi:hypothetical protein
VVEERQQSWVVDEVVEDARLGENVVEALGLEAFEGVAACGARRRRLSLRMASQVCASSAR